MRLCIVAWYTLLHCDLMLGLSVASSSFVDVNPEKVKITWRPLSRTNPRSKPGDDERTDQQLSLGEYR